MSDIQAIRERHEKDKKFFAKEWQLPWEQDDCILAVTDIATLLSALSAAEARAEAAEARVGELEEALLQHNERLRSAIAVADRNGAETNWKAFRGELHYTAAEYHELVNSIRTLKGAPDGR